jgi:hypothetical protein
MSIIIHFAVSLALVILSSFVLGPGLPDGPFQDYFLLIIFLGSLLSLLISLIRALIEWGQN